MTDSELLLLWDDHAPNPYPRESGPLSIDGVQWMNQGKVWRHRGASMFTLPARFAAGQDITPQVRWMQRHRVSTARVFPNWTKVDGSASNFHADDRAFADPAYPGILSDFADRLALEGLRLQASLVTENGIPVDYWRRALQQCYEIGFSRWNWTQETHNEPWTRDTTPYQVLSGVRRYGVLSSMGILATGHPTLDEWLPIPAADHMEFYTHRTSRDRYFPKNGKDLQDIRSTSRLPCIDDEPMGIVDVVTRGGRTNDKDAVLSHFAVAALFGGATIHTQAGIDGLTPEQTHEPLTEAICDGITALWDFLPPEVQLGNYVNTGVNGGTGIVYAHDDSLVNRAYGSLLGDDLWCVVPVPRPGWELKLKSGFRLDEQGPIPGVFRLERT